MSLRKVLGGIVAFCAAFFLLLPSASAETAPLPSDGGVQVQVDSPESTESVEPTSTSDGTSDRSDTPAPQNEDADSAPPSVALESSSDPNPVPVQPVSRVSACDVIPSDRIDVTFATQSGGDEVSAWEWFQYEINLGPLDGLAEGCTATVSLDSSLFGGMNSATLYLNADGSSSPSAQDNTVAVMFVDGPSATMTFTLTGYALSHVDVWASGWAKAQLNSSIIRGETTPIEITINGETRRVGAIVGAPCEEGCGELPSYAAKWGSVNDDGSGVVVIQTPVIEDASRVTVTDVLDSPDQAIVGVASVLAYNCVDTWDNPGVQTTDGCDTSTHIPADYVDKGEGRYVLSSSESNVFFRLALYMLFEGPGPWSDTTTIRTADGGEWSDSTTVSYVEVGGGGSGHGLKAPVVTLTPQACSEQGGETGVITGQISNPNKAEITGTVTLGDQVVEGTVPANGTVDFELTGIPAGEHTVTFDGSQGLTVQATIVVEECEPTPPTPVTPTPTTSTSVSPVPSTPPVSAGGGSAGGGTSDRKGSDLATTGGEIAPLGMVAGVLVIAGAAALLLRRRA